MKKRQKSYQVNVQVEVHTEIEVKAESYEEALEKARELGVKDVVDFDTSFNDGNVRVTGVWNFDEEPHK